MFTKKYTDCLHAYTQGIVGPASSEPVKVILADDSTKECTFENLFDMTESCPKGWTGSADDDSCLKVFPESVTNSEASMLCNQNGAELIQIESEADDDRVTAILEGAQEYSIPTHPGFYHIGTYQRQSGKQYYHGNGARV